MRWKMGKVPLYWVNIAAREHAKRREVQARRVERQMQEEFGLEETVEIMKVIGSHVGYKA